MGTQERLEAQQRAVEEVQARLREEAEREEREEREAAARRRAEAQEAKRRGQDERAERKRRVRAVAAAVPAALDVCTCNPSLHSILLTPRTGTLLLFDSHSPACRHSETFVHRARG